jgi:hypothetical protein
MLAAAAAAAAAFIARPFAARAADDDPMLVGNAHTAESKTSLSTSTAETAFEVVNVRTTPMSGGGAPIGVYSSAPSGFGVFGASSSVAGVRGNGIEIGGNGVEGLAQENGFGVWGHSASGIGVRGEATDDDGVQGLSSTATGVSGISTSGRGIAGFSSSNSGVYGTSSTGRAIEGVSDATSQPAIRGISRNGNRTGVLGYSGPDADLPAAVAQVGVYGHAQQSASARGVLGRSASGQGVRGEATNGTGGYFTATDGTALHAVGPVRFSSAGLATIAAGTKSVVVTPGLDVTTSSKVLALPQTNPGGTTTVQRIARNATANTFTIYLTANATANTTVAWFVIS